MALRDMVDIELELNQVLDDVKEQIAQVKREAVPYGKTGYDYRNQNGDPTLGPLLNIQANALHSLLICKGEH